MRSFTELAEEALKEVPLRSAFTQIDHEAPLGDAQDALVREVLTELYRVMDVYQPQFDALGETPVVVFALFSALGPTMVLKRLANMRQMTSPPYAEGMRLAGYLAAQPRSAEIHTAAAELHYLAGHTVKVWFDHMKERGKCVPE